jgi:hypothetical protein
MSIVPYYNRKDLLTLSSTLGCLSHPLLYARIPQNQLKVRQFGVLVSIPQLTFTEILTEKE